MNSFVNSVVTIVLLILGLIVGPVLSYETSQNNLARQAVVNDTNTFLDGLSDRAYVTGAELDEYINMINSHGLKMNADLQVSERVPSTDVDGNAITLTITKYNDIDLLDSTDKRLFNKGDIIEIDLQEIGMSNWRGLFYRLLRLDPGGFNYHMANTVQ